MPLNGSGGYVLPAGQPVVSGTTITSTAQNAFTADLVSVLSNALYKDGQQTTTQSIPFAQGATFGGTALTIAASGQITSLYDGESSYAFLTASGDAGTTGYFKSTGFGFTATFNTLGITTSYTSGFSVVCVSGGVVLLDGATSWSAISDERNKEGLTPIANGLDKVASLRAVTGRYKTDDPSVSRSFLIAQDVQKVLPEAVKADGHGILHLAITDVIPLLVSALKETQGRLQTLEWKLL